MPGDDHLVLADQDRVGEAEFRDRGRDLRHLIGGMRPGVAAIRHKPVGRHHLDLHGHGGSGMWQAGRNPGLGGRARLWCHPWQPGNPRVATRGGNPEKMSGTSGLSGLCPPHTDPARVEPRRGWAAGGEASGAPPDGDRSAPGLQEPCTRLRSWGNTGLKVLHLSRPKFDVPGRYNNVPGPPSSGFTTVFAAAGFAGTAFRAGFSKAFRCLAMVRRDAAHLRQAVVRTTPAR